MTRGRTQEVAGFTPRDPSFGPCEGAFARESSAITPDPSAQVRGISASLWLGVYTNSTLRPPPPAVCSRLRTEPAFSPLGSSCLNALVKAFDDIHTVRAANSGYSGSKYSFGIRTYASRPNYTDALISARAGGNQQWLSLPRSTVVAGFLA